MENKWISVNDRLPEKKGFYLVNVEDRVASHQRGSVEIGECFSTVKQVNKKLQEGIKFHDYVTHWMPLPEPPKQ